MGLYGYPEVLDYDLLAIEGFRRIVFRVNEHHVGVVDVRIGHFSAAGLGVIETLIGL